MEKAIYDDVAANALVCKFRQILLESLNTLAGLLGLVKEKINRVLHFRSFARIAAPHMSTKKAKACTLKTTVNAFWTLPS